MTNQEALHGEFHCLGSALTQRAASQAPGQGYQSPQGPTAGSPDSSHTHHTGCRHQNSGRGSGNPKDRGEWGRGSYLRQATLHFGISVPAQRPVLWVSFEATQDKPVHMSS